MSVKLSFDSPSEEGVVQRSRSFTGFSSLSGRRRPSSLRHSLRSKAQFSAKYPRVHLSPSRVGGGLSPQQPQQVDRIFQALRKGLKEYVEGHQAEMDFLSSQQRETKRNSRLAFLYDLEKEIRALERHIRRLEFQISKVEELYETYCIQWRLCQGAINMKRAFSLSPSTRASRDSLMELSRTHRHGLQDMSVMEGELEILLGELHIKMKGLIGFARLCPGDQYEVVVRLGRQRWRIRGRIQSDDRQYWDEEEMVFLPHIHHNFEIKVTEAKGLGWLLVGTVTCASADFFVARPQLMLVDITELGTIKLQLEVTWNPFDSGEKMRPVSPSRKSSVYSWTAPTTPSFTEKYFISMVRHLQDADGSVPSLVPRPRPPRGGVSLLSYLSDPAHSVIAPPPNHTSTPLTGRFHSSLSTRTSSPSLGTSVGGSQSQLSLGEDGSLEVTLEDTQSMRTLGDEEWTRGVSETKRCSTPDILRQNPETEPGLRQTSDSGQESPEGRTDFTPFPDPTPSPPPTSVPPLSPSPPITPSSLPPSKPPSPSPAPPSGPVSIPPSVAPSLGRPVVSWAQRKAQAVSVGTLMAELENRCLQNHGCSSEKELRMLDNQILHLATILKNDLSMLKSSSSSSEETLAVEEVLGSFDFLSDDDTSCLGSLRLKEIGQSASEEELAIAPLTSGNWSLDQTLETHLDICTILLQVVRTVHFSLSVRELLEEVTLQAAVLEHINALLLEKNNNISTTDILPQAQRSRELLLFWNECIGGDDGGSSPFCCHADSFSRALRVRYSHRVKAKQPGQSETVFCQVLQGVLSCCGLVPSPRPVCSPERVTVFQLSVYLKRWNIQDLGQHITRLSREVYLESSLRSPKRRRALTKLRGRSLAELLPLGRTLHTLAALQVESNHKVCKAAASCLGRAAACRALRNKAIVYYTESLKQNDVQLQQAACLALKCLKATDSVDHIAELWRSTDDDLRAAARETVLSFGKKGFQAFQRMDQLYVELQEEAYRNQQTEITIL